jgi:hypothetical protein
VAGEFACDGDRDDRAPLATPLERVPVFMQPPGALIGAGANRCRLALAALRERRALAQRPPLLPGRLDKQPPRVAVAGLDDPAEPPLLPGRVLARRQPQKRGGKRVQSPSSTVSASPVRVETPRRQQSRLTTSANGASAASSAIA